jgi:hypothetical protein
MAPIRCEIFDPLLPEAQAREMLRLCERFGRYGTYAEESVADEFGNVLPQRYDAAVNFVRTGGRFARREPAETLAARTNYFRETYAYGDAIRLPGIEPFYHHDAFLEAARKIHDRPLVKPAIVYANVLVPGQELAVHTDVPEFRGMSRKQDPQWLLVAMHHSGLFERWRMPIATAVAYFESCAGGEFVFYPDGREGAPHTLPARHNTSVILDTDSVFHGVDRVADGGRAIPRIRPGAELVFAGDGSWRVELGGETLARHRWGEIRFSVSWKAWCFADAAEERAVREHRDDVTRAKALATLVADLRARGKLGEETLPDRELALRIIEEYIRFPEPREAA